MFATVVVIFFIVGSSLLKWPQLGDAMMLTGSQANTLGVILIVLSVLLSVIYFATRN